jgi:4-carboxymuconolactone decarboxylase
MSDEEAAVYDLATELMTHHGVSDGTYREAVTRFGEQGAVDLVAIVGYFTLMSMELNVAQTPAEEVTGIQRLQPLP